MGEVEQGVVVALHHSPNGSRFENFGSPGHGDGDAQGHGAAHGKQLRHFQDVGIPCGDPGPHQLTGGGTVHQLRSRPCPKTVLQQISGLRRHQQFMQQEWTAFAGGAQQASGSPVHHTAEMTFGHVQQLGVAHSRKIQHLGQAVDGDATHGVRNFIGRSHGSQHGGHVLHPDVMDEGGGPIVEHLGVVHHQQLSRFGPAQ